MITPLGAANQWHDIDGIDWSLVPKAQQAWLQTVTKLTDHLREKSQHSVTLELINEAWADSDDSSRDYLPSISQRVWRREICFKRNDLCCEWGLTIVPESSVNDDTAELLSLGNKPFGDLVFADTATRREALQIACLDQQHPYYIAAKNVLNTSPDFFWARRSRFIYRQQPVLVSEIVLPERLRSE